jgi:hypothetical protein
VPSSQPIKISKATEYHSIQEECMALVINNAYRRLEPTDADHFSNVQFAMLVQEVRPRGGGGLWMVTSVGKGSGGGLVGVCGW